LAGGGARDSNVGRHTLRVRPAAAGVTPTIVIRGGPEERTEELLGCRWQLVPA
jgi:hypothetical protein